jgi:hypothetical protein
MAVDIQFNVDQALQKLGELVQQHGPQAINLAAQVVRVDGLSSIVRGAGMAILGAGLGYAAYRTARASIRENCKDILEQNVGLAVGSAFGAAALAIGTALLAINAYADLADPWNWVALLNPKLALAHQVLAKIAGV